jgi:hypothetical protein
MAAGLRCWDDQGRLVVDLTTRLGRVVGVQNITASATGTIAVPGGFGDLFVFTFSSGLSDQSAGYTPAIVVASNGMSFTYGPNINYPGGPRAYTLLWGFK